MGNFEQIASATDTKNRSSVYVCVVQKLILITSTRLGKITAKLAEEIFRTCGVIF